MSRIRTLKPELPGDTGLARCSRDARLTFVYLITQADDYGLMPASPRQLLGALYPNDEDVTAAMVMGWIQELVDAGRCQWRATRDGARVVQLLNWEKHQRIDNRRKPVLLDTLVDGAAEAPHPPRGDLKTIPIPLAVVRGEPAADRGGIPLEPPTSDLRPPTKELEQRVPSNDTSGDPLDDPVVVALCRASRSPTAVRAELTALATGMRGTPAPPWPIIIRALAEMAAAGETYNPSRHRGYCRRILETPDSLVPSAPKGRSAFDDDEEVA